MFDPDGMNLSIIIDIVENFADITRQAFDEYHAVRALKRAEAEAEAETEADDDYNKDYGCVQLVDTTDAE